MSKPLICHAGKVCDQIGLVSPASSCPKGYGCLAGTKSRIPLKIEPNISTWVIQEGNKTPSTLLGLGFTDKLYDQQLIPTTETNSEHQLSRLLHKGAHSQQEQNIMMEPGHPIPCDIGMFCREGVSSLTSVLGNFSTPQPCYPGFFCGQGHSYTPEGSGPCPTGHYCPNSFLAIPSLIGHQCRGEGNIKPTLCHPGTYSETTGQSSCTPCNHGICPEWGMIQPKICPGGFVCDAVGLSVPSKSCPPGFICPPGTTTDDPDSKLSSRPLPCPAGKFCLSGVAHNKSIEWIPSQEEGKFAPQQCHEGYYCKEASSSPSGMCFAGHYCPPGTQYPKKVPVGTFSKKGAIVPVLCFPGTYASARGSNKCSPSPSGHSCIEYGMSVPRVCDYGTYRSVADSITCKPCPPATYLPHRGGTDISECQPIPGLRVSMKKGLNDLTFSEPCDGAHICSDATEGSNQYNHKCPSGHVCLAGGTTPILQYDLACESGYQCKQGTSEELMHKDQCPQKKVCPKGTSDSTSESYQCPRQTSSNPGSKSIHNCYIEDVGICDKDPDGHNTYYNNHQSSEVDKYQQSSIEPMMHKIASMAKVGIIGERVALKKISPITQNHSQKQLLWKNETVEVIQSCPTYAIAKNVTNWIIRNITLIGRNFQPTKMLSCRFRVQKQGVLSMGYQQASEIRTSGTFLSSTQLSCPMPFFNQFKDALEESANLNPTCITDETGFMYYKRECNKNTDTKCVGSHAKKDRHERHYSLFLQCDSKEISLGMCDDLPSKGFKSNPCFSVDIVVDVSNDGKRFSGNATYVPYTRDINLEKTKEKKPFVIPPSETILNVIYSSSPRFYQIEKSSRSFQKFYQHSKKLLDLHKASCLKERGSQESNDLSEHGWFQLPFMSQAHLSIDWRHIPSNIIYNEHFKLSIFATPSRCKQTRCNSQRVQINDEETTPCVKPLPLPEWFTDTSVSKHQLLNLTLLALDDVLFKAEIHIINGLYLPTSPLFLNSADISILGLNKAASETSLTRVLSPYLSWEKNEVPMEFIFASILTPDHTRTFSPPLNLPPRWKDFERGRVLVSMNTTQESSTPTIKDDPKMMPLNMINSFWKNPFQTTEDAKVATDEFLETFHGMSFDPDGGYDYDMRSLMLPYLPFFSNCREFDSHIPLSHTIKNEIMCNLPVIGDLYPIDWWRRSYKALPHPDDIKTVGPFDFTRFHPTADWCERKIFCNYEEELQQQDITPPWFQAKTGTKLFSILRDPVNYFQYTGRSGHSTEMNDGGGDRFTKSIDLSSDHFLPVKIRRNSDSEDCNILCFPRKLTLDISYHQVNETSKRLVEIELIYENFDKDATNSNYELDLKFYPLNYQELIVKFAFSRGIFFVLFTGIGVFTVAIALLYWILVRLTTQIAHPPKLRFGSTLWLIFPQALIGFLLGLLPIVIITAGISFLIKGQQYFLAPDISSNFLQNWSIFQTTPLHYMDSFVDPLAFATTRQGRLGMAFIIVAIVSIFEGSKMFVPRRNSKRERELELIREKDASKSFWDVILWKRGNLIFSSILMGLLLVMIVGKQ